MKRFIPALILLILLPYLGPLAAVGGCPHHGRGCTHGSSCPTAQRQAVQEAAICHTGVQAEPQEKAKTYRCSISSCHGEESQSLTDMPLIVSMAASMSVRVSAPLFQQELQMNEDLSPQDILEPPESLSYS
ncbi:MAG: hypothetical protein A2052_00065 [Deltaproteobacteria bacterium GWA2_54_12]|nr:MAG: hypothetical protein A2052_00065 [Deltaproteobacteria bacterium GWA2_54_12]